MLDSTIYNIGDIRIKVNFLCPFLIYNPLCGSHQFIVSDHDYDWIINIDTTENIEISDFTSVFKGSQAFEKEIPYKWQLLIHKSNKYIHFEFEKDKDVYDGLACIDDNTNTIDLKLRFKHKQAISIDPFFHPIGILMLQYILHKSHGFIMHASAVDYNNTGYLFSAISGTGKSTMANLWKQKGATIINDDRIIVRQFNDNIVLYNTPMPYYSDRPKKSNLKKLFILKQSENNYIQPFNQINGTLSILSNCIQYHFNELQISERFDYIAQAVQRHGVFEVGFKPDTDIVDLIIKQFG